MATPLAPQAILQRMADALPTHPKDDPSSDLSSSYEVIALASHACMASLGFRLLGFDEEKRIEAEIASHAPRLPPSWNAGFGTLSFVYAHKQTSMTDVVNVTRMGTKIEVRALAVGHDVIHRFEIAPRDLVDASKLPLRITLGADGAEEDRTDLPAGIGKLFVSEQKLTEFIERFKKEIIQKLIPKLQAEGYVESEDDRDARRQADDENRGQARREPGRPFQPAGDPRPYPLADPLAEPHRPLRPVPAGDFPPPDFEDEYEIGRPPRGSGGGLAIPGRSPFNIGHDDLNPPGLGPHDPLRPSFVGGGGLPRPAGGGGGMHPTFDDPLFGGHGGQGDGFDPQAPPGARWDPVGPGFPRPGGNPFGSGGRGRGGFGGGYGGDII